VDAATVQAAALTAAFREGTKNLPLAEASAKFEGAQCAIYPQRHQTAIGL
jgi:hypothetical protein